MDSGHYFWINKNTTAEWLQERTAVSLHDWDVGTLLRIMTRWVDNYVRDVQTRKILIAGKYFASHSFKMLEIQRGKGKTLWTHGSFQTRTKRIKYNCPKTTSSPFSSWESLQQTRLTYLGWKTTQEAFKLSMKYSDRSLLILFWRC